MAQSTSRITKPNSPTHGEAESENPTVFDNASTFTRLTGLFSNSLWPSSFDSAQPSSNRIQRRPSPPLESQALVPSQRAQPNDLSVERYDDDIEILGIRPAEKRSDQITETGEIRKSSRQSIPTPFLHIHHQGSDVTRVLQKSKATPHVEEDPSKILQEEGVFQSLGIILTHNDSRWKKLKISGEYKTRLIDSGAMAMYTAYLKKIGQVLKRSSFCTQSTSGSTPKVSLARCVLEDLSSIQRGGPLEDGISIANMRKLMSEKGPENRHCSIFFHYVIPMLHHIDVGEWPWWVNAIPSVKIEGEHEPDARVPRGYDHQRDFFDVARDKSWAQDTCTSNTLLLQTAITHYLLVVGISYQQQFLDYILGDATSSDCSDIVQERRTTDVAGGGQDWRPATWHLYQLEDAVLLFSAILVALITRRPWVNFFFFFFFYYRNRFKNYIK